MTGDEVRTRAAQELTKRLDLLKYRAGIGQRPSKLRSGDGCNPRFFFDQPAERAALLRQHLPQESTAIIREADEVCRHEFRLLGYDKVDYGREIDWHSSHGKRGPLLPWFKINFLDYHSVGDHKVVWELNRHQHLVTLAKAWLLTGKEAYTAELVTQWYAWQKSNPYPLGINWASTLEVAFRSLSWLWVRNLLATCPNAPASFENDLLLALQVHGRYIERYLSTYFSPNTHLLGEAVSLFFIGTLCPHLPHARQWQNHGWNIVLQEAKRQVRADGVYFEQALYYHVYALDFFLYARILAAGNGLAVPAEFDEVIQRMLNVVEALAEAGSIESFGDDDGGRLFNPQRNRAEFLSDPLALGASVYDRKKYSAATLTEESIWLFGDKAIQALAADSPQPEAASKAFPDGGIYLLNDVDPYPQQLMIDAGPQGTGNSGHGHADALSLRFTSNGRRFLVDPGTYCYSCSIEERDSFRGTGAHNTVRVDNLDQAVSQGQFAWSSLPNTITETWTNGQTFDFFIGSHDGYCRLSDPVLHRRFIFHVKGGLWFVRDFVEGRSKHLLESFWHFAPDLQVEAEGGMIVAQPAHSSDGIEPARLALVTDRDSGWSTDIVEGFVSPAYGAKQVSKVVRMSCDAPLPNDVGVLLVPMAKSAQAGTLTTLGEGSISEVRAYRYQNGQTSEFVFFAQPNKHWECGPWSSDSQFLYCKLERGRFIHVIMVSGTFGEWRGKRFVSQPSRTESFEWLARPGSKKLSSSEAAVFDDSLICDFEVFDSVP